MFALVHGQGQRLQDEVRGVTVNYQARKTVAFTPDQPARIAVIQPFLAETSGLFDTPEKEIAIELLALPRKSPRHYLGPGIIDGTTQSPIPPVFELNDT